MAERYKSIGMRETDYQAIAEKKRAVESLLRKRLDWADFLLLLANIRPIEEIAFQHREGLAELHEGEPMTEEDMAEAGIEVFDGLLVTLAESDQERIAELVATKVVERLRG